MALLQLYVILVLWYCGVPDMRVSLDISSMAQWIQPCIRERAIVFNCLIIKNEFLRVAAVGETLYVLMSKKQDTCTDMQLRPCMREGQKINSCKKSLPLHSIKPCYCITQNFRGAKISRICHFRHFWHLNLQNEHIERVPSCLLVFKSSKSDHY